MNASLGAGTNYRRLLEQSQVWERNGSYAVPLCQLSAKSLLQAGLFLTEHATELAELAAGTSDDLRALAPGETPEEWILSTPLFGEIIFQLTVRRFTP